MNFPLCSLAIIALLTSALHAQETPSKSITLTEIDGRTWLATSESVNLTVSPATMALPASCSLSMFGASDFGVRLGSFGK